MSFVHNRRAAAFTLVAAGLALALLGAGCSPKGRQSNSGALDQGPGTIPAPSDASNALPTKWAEYRSEKLGITIPYPEGWYVEEGGRGNSTTILVDEQSLPSLDEPSDATATVGVTIGSFSLADAVRSYGSEVQTSAVALGSRNVTRLDYETELGAAIDARPRTVYLWEADGSAIVVQGDADSPVLLRIAGDLASKPGRR